MTISTGFSLPRLAINLSINALLLPFYIFLFLLTTIIALTPLFPARVARSNLRSKMGATGLGVILGTGAVLFHYVLVVVEDFVFWPIGGLLIRDNPETRAQLESASIYAHENSLGIAVLAAHFGNIEVTGDALALTLKKHVAPSTPIMALAKPSKNLGVTRLLAWYRAKRKIEIIFTNRKDLVRAMLQSFKQGRALALLVDQKPASAGRFVDFFGAPAAFPDGGIEVALRSKSEFICATSRRIWPGCYTFEGQWLQNERLSEEPAEAILRSYARWLEDVIALSPWQWCWDYKKWSRQPTHVAPANSDLQTS